MYNVSLEWKRYSLGGYYKWSWLLLSDSFSWECIYLYKITAYHL